jgi:hypothetical protein
MIYYHFYYKTLGLKNQKLIWIQMSNFTLEEEEEVLMKKLPILFSKKCMTDYTYINGQLGFLWKKLNNCSLLEFLQRGCHVIHQTMSGFLDFPMLAGMIRTNLFTFCMKPNLSWYIYIYSGNEKPTSHLEDYYRTLKQMSLKVTLLLLWFQDDL